jgi:hypothetical protein
VSGYVPQASDVSEAVDRAVCDALRELTPSQRLQIAMRASRALHRLSVAGLRLRFPAASDANSNVVPARCVSVPSWTRMAFGPAAETWSDSNVGASCSIRRPAQDSTRRRRRGSWSRSWPGSDREGRRAIGNGATCSVS